MTFLRVLSKVFYRIFGVFYFYCFGVVGFRFVRTVGGIPILNLLGGKLEIKKNLRMQNRQFRTEITVKQGATLEIGENTFINQGCSIVVASHMIIGPNCLIGDLVSIRDHNSHEIDQGAKDVIKRVIIGKNVWIGARAIILAGVSIGDHSVVAAGSVVTENIPPKCIVAGVPAKFVRAVKCSDEYLRI